MRPSSWLTGAAFSSRRDPRTPSQRRSTRSSRTRCFAPQSRGVHTSTPAGWSGPRSAPPTGHSSRTSRAPWRSDLQMPSRPKTRPERRSWPPLVADVARRALAPMHAISRRHLDVLSDEVGIMQHAIGSKPDPAHGYCVDDVARALEVDLLHAGFLGWPAVGG